MNSVSSFEAKTRFGELLDRVSRGEEVIITRHDKPIARIVPEGRPAMSEIRDAVADLRALRREIASRPKFKPLSDKEIRHAINEGRR